MKENRSDMNNQRGGFLSKIFVIPAGVEHDLENQGGTVATLLVISSPALR